jgi:hypothetical protein
LSVVLSGRGLCDRLITRTEESYRLWRVVVCDLEILVNEEALAHRGLSSLKETMQSTMIVFIANKGLVEERDKTVPTALQRIQRKHTHYMLPHHLSI